MKFNADFECDVSFVHTGSWSPLRAGDFQICGLEYFLYTFALLSERCNFVKIITTKIFMRTILVENFMQHTLGNMTFFSKVHISRENRERVILDSPFDPLCSKGGTELGVVGVIIISSVDPFISWTET